MEPMPCQPAACAAAASTAQHPGQPPPALDLAEVFQARVPVVEPGPPTAPRACPCTGRLVKRGSVSHFTKELQCGASLEKKNCIPVLSRARGQ